MQIYKRKLFKSIFKIDKVRENHKFSFRNLTGALLVQFRKYNIWLFKTEGIYDSWPSCS